MSQVALYRSTISAIANALVVAVQGVKLADNVTAAFGSVKLFDSENLADAFQHLVITDQRVCVIVMLDEKWEKISSHPKLMLRRKIPAALLISDRVLGDRQAALYGNAQTPGAYGLYELVLPAVVGQLIDNPNGVVCAPENSSVMNISLKEQKQLPNRICVGLILECSGGRMETSLDPAPVP